MPPIIVSWKSKKDGDTASFNIKTKDGLGIGKRNSLLEMSKRNALHKAVETNIKQLESVSEENAKVVYSGMLSNTMKLLSKQFVKYLKKHAIITKQEEDGTGNDNTNAMLVYGKYVNGLKINGENMDTTTEPDMESQDFLRNRIMGIDTDTIEGSFLKRWADDTVSLNMNSNAIKYNLGMMSDLKPDMVSMYQSGELKPWEKDLQNESTETHLDELYNFIHQVFYALFATNKNGDSIYSEKMVKPSIDEKNNEKFETQMIKYYMDYIHNGINMYDDMENKDDVRDIIKNVLDDNWKQTKNNFIRHSYRTRISDMDDVNTEDIPHISYGDKETWAIGTSVVEVEILNDLILKIINGIITHFKKDITEKYNEFNYDEIRDYILNELENKNIKCKKEDGENNDKILISRKDKGKLSTTRIVYDDLYTIKLVKITGEKDIMCNVNSLRPYSEKADIFKLKIYSTGQMVYALAGEIDPPDPDNILENIHQYTANTNIRIKTQNNRCYVYLENYTENIHALDIDVIDDVMDNFDYERIGERNRENIDSEIKAEIPIVDIYDLIITKFVGFYGTSVRSISRNTHTILFNSYAQKIKSYYKKERINGVQHGYFYNYEDPDEFLTNKLGYILFQTLKDTYDASKHGNIPLVIHGRTKITGPPPLSMMSIHDIEEILSPTPKFITQYSSLWYKIEEIVELHSRNGRTGTQGSISDIVERNKGIRNRRKRIRFTENDNSTIRYNGVLPLNKLLYTIGKENVDFFACILNMWVSLEQSNDDAKRSRQRTVLGDNYKELGGRIIQLVYTCVSVK